MTTEKPSSRDLLLAAALDAFGHHGFNSTTTRDIAQAAGMPMSQITYHFGGKDGLYLACARMIADHMAARLSEALAGVEAALEAGSDRHTARGCLASLLGGLVTAILDPATLPFTRFAIREQADPTPAFAILYGGVMARVLGVLESLIALMSGRPGEPARIMAITLVGQVMVFRVAQSSVLTFTGWSAITPEHLPAIRQTLLFNAQAICDRLEKGLFP